MGVDPVIETDPHPIVADPAPSAPVAGDDRATTHEPHGEAAGATRWWGTASLTLFGATVLGFVLHARYGYRAGGDDHMVLSPLGLHWADPGYFAGDWFIREAPQPHWLFDVVTWFGASIGQLAVVYFAYWVLSLLVFGYATAVLARAWAPRHPAVATGLVTLLAGVTPWWLLGTGSPLYPQALPVVLGGALLYLTLAALLTDRRVLAVVAAVATALVHVQQGLVVAVLLLAMVVWRLASARTVDRLYLAGTALVGGVVHGALTARPVVGDLDQFAQVCRELIPYHCEASAWPGSHVIAGFAMVAMALLTVCHQERGTRGRWAVVVALPAVGLVAGVLADRYDVPVLGVAAQGLNVYRLGALMVVLCCWGVLAPVFGALSPLWRVVLAVVVVGLGWLVTGIREWESRPAIPEHGGPWLLVFVAGLAIAVAAGGVRGRRRSRARWLRVGAVVMVAGVVAAMVAEGRVAVRALDLTFVPDDKTREWGAAVHATLPRDAVLLAPPLAAYVRLATGHSVVANCKDVPYGGAAWRHYVARLDSMGGVAQCVLRQPGVFNSMPAASVEQVARRWGADHLVVEEGQAWRTPDLLARGWRVVLRPTGQLRNTVLAAPWARAGA